MGKFTDVRKALLKLGVVGIVIGSLCTILTIIHLTALSFHVFHGTNYGVWGGIMFIVTGILGVVAGKKQSKCPIIAFLVLSVLSCVFAVIVLSLAAVETADMLHFLKQYGYDRRSPHMFRASIAVAALITVLGFIEFCVALTGSIFCCLGLSSSPESQLLRPE